MAPTPEDIWSITRLTRMIKQVLSSALPPIWVEGEISNYYRSGAGHGYLTLKDDHSQLKAVIWRKDMAKIPFEPTDGSKVLAYGSLDVYETRGQYQLTVRRLLPKGVGPLELKLRQLREKLDGEGLFRTERKRPIPRFPRRVVLITSPQGAAIRDFLEIYSRRWQGAEILVIPSSVQGEKAPGELIDALSAAQRTDADLIAMVRGGGSLEDLWAFNDEELARTIYASSLPVVTGIGHEIDVTIADLVADLRALTPSEAAEHIFPDEKNVLESLSQFEQRLGAWVRETLQQAHHLLRTLEASRPMALPLEMLTERARRSDELEASLCRAVRRRLDDSNRIVSLRANALDALSPLRVLRRGYSLTTLLPSDKLIRSIRELNRENRLRVRFGDGYAKCRVEEITELEPSSDE